MSFIRVVVWVLTLTTFVGLVEGATDKAQPPQPVLEFQASVDLRAMYGVIGSCTAFSPDSNWLSTLNGIYDAETGRQHLELRGKYFSPDGSMIVVLGDGIYDVLTGDRVFDLEGSTALDPVVFSPDMQFIALKADAVYDLKTGETLFAIGGESYSNILFSSDSRFLAVGGDGLYDLSSGQKWIATTGLQMAFTPDETKLIIANDGVYDLATFLPDFRFTGGEFTLSPDGSLLAAAGSALYEMESGEQRLSFYGVPHFSPDSKLLAVSTEGVYETATGVQHFQIEGEYYGDLSFSPHSRYLAVANVGVYEVETGEIVATINGPPQFAPEGDWLVVRGDGLYTVPGFQKQVNLSGMNIAFSPDGQMVSVEDDGVFELATGAQLLPTDAIFANDGRKLAVSIGPACTVYGPFDPSYDYPTGTIRVEQRVAVHDTPNGTVIDSIANSEVNVFALSSNGRWFKIGSERWIPREFVAEEIEIPVNFPYEFQ